jgi:hypothetical protein
MRSSRWVWVMAVVGLGACGGSDLVIDISAPTAPVAADGQTPATLSIQVLEGGSPIGSGRSGTLSFSTDVGSLVPIDVDGGDSPFPELANQQLQVDFSGAPVSEELFSALPGTAHILVRYTDAFDGFALQRTTVTFK